MTIKEILKEKTSRLNSVPEEFLTKVEKSQKQIFSKLIELTSGFERVDGKIVPNIKNLRLADSINAQLSEVLFGSDYLEAVKQFASEFDTQKEVNDKYFKKAFPDFTTSEIADKILSQSKKTAVEALAGSTVQSGFLEPLKEQINIIVQSGSSWQDAVQQLRLYAEGDDEVDGKLLKYSKEIATDAIATSDRAYTSAVADDLESEWFLYAGDIIPTSRCFCIERHNKYFYYKEIESWGRMENLGECNIGDGWAGMNETTNESNIFILAGGWYCNHSIMPVTIDQVPKEVIQDAIDRFGFNPSAFEREELGI